MARFHHSTDRVSRETALGMPAWGRPPEWTRAGHCLDHPEWGPDTWHEHGFERVAADVCNGSELEGKPCVVRGQCLAFALDNEFRQGVWGGLYGKALGKLVDEAKKMHELERLTAQLERESKCGKGHLLTADNLTPSGKCLLCAKDQAVFRRSKADLVKRGELTA
jgi:hypothetical protein